MEALLVSYGIDWANLWSLAAPDHGIAWIGASFYFRLAG
jgi:uncharacterized membrane protein